MGDLRQSYLDDHVALYTGDCLDLLPRMGNDSIDMVFADPPFNLGKKYGKEVDDNLPIEKYMQWCSEWIAECWRVLKPTGTFYLMTIDRHLEWVLPMMAKGGVHINIVHWRNVSASHNRRCFWPSTQPIVVYGKTNEYIFNTYAQKRKIALENQRWGGYTTEAKGQMLDYWDTIPFVYAGSVHHEEAVIEKGTNKKSHPAQMPEGLTTRAILYSTLPDAIVLDPMMGSGTTGVSCIECGRNFIGADKISKYVSIAKKRIRDAQSQMMMPLMKEILES